MTDGGAAPDWSKLTAAEYRVLCLVAQYKTNKQIATGLQLSTRTVEQHRFNIGAKLGLKGRHALLEFAARHAVRLCAQE